MPQHVRGVVARAKGEPVAIETILIPDPGPGEAVVRIQSCGVCHISQVGKVGRGAARTERHRHLVLGFPGPRIPHLILQGFEPGSTGI